MNPIIVLCSRLNSSRLPAKALLPINNKPLIIFLADRLKRFCNNNIIICATKNKYNDIIEDYMGKDYKVYREKPNNLVLGMLEIAELENADFIVRVTGDNPYTCPLILNQLIDSIGNLDYLRMDGLPKGVTSEIIRRDILEYLNENVADKIDLSNKLTDYIFKTRNVFNIRQLCAPIELLRPKYSVTIDTLDDYIHVYNLSKKIDNDKSDVIYDIVKIMDLGMSTN